MHVLFEILRLTVLEAKINAILVLLTA